MAKCPEVVAAPEEAIAAQLVVEASGIFGTIRRCVVRAGCVQQAEAWTLECRPELERRGYVLLSDCLNESVSAVGSSFCIGPSKQPKCGGFYAALGPACKRVPSARQHFTLPRQEAIITTCSVLSLAHHTTTTYWQLNPDHIVGTIQRPPASSMRPSFTSTSSQMAALDDDSWGGSPWPPGAGCEAPRPFDRWVIANDSEVELVGPAGRLKDHIATAHSTAARPVILFYEAAPGVTREARTSVTLVARPAAEQAAPAAQRSTCRKMQVRAGWVVFVQGFAPGQGARTPVRVGACCCW